MHNFNEDIRPPDESRFETLVPAQRSYASRPRANGLPRRRQHGVARQNTREYRDNTYQAEEDAYMRAIMEMSQREYQENFDMARILQESAEEYERECMSINDAESNSSLINISRKLPTTIIQFKKLGRFDAEMLGLLKSINAGALDESVCSKIGEKIKLISRTDILQGKATQYVWKLTLAGKYDVTVLGVLPNVKTKVPVFIGLNFCGNQTTSNDPNIPIFDKYTVCNNKPAYINNKGQEESRGAWASRWQFEKLIAAGYGSITIACGDFEEDKPDGYLTGVRTLLAKELGLQADEWSANGAWAWGLNRTVDFLEKIPQIDSKRILLHGHSRLGKAALWAGATDTRYAAVISNESGEGGAAIARRNFGENLWRITNSFPHWFYKDYKNYAYKENELPFDSHILLSLVAPRPLYIASAVGDQWSDPKGEFMGGQQAEAVYQLFGKTGLGKNEFPALNTPVGQQVRYHIREGNHDINAYDWDQYIDFANKLVK